MKKTRREFTKKITAAILLSPFINPFDIPNRSLNTSDELAVSIFSKHLQFLDYRTVGEMAAEMGFSGVDLTVRPRGHVLPENVKTDLSKAVKDIRKGGSRCEIITTRIESVNNPYDIDIIKTAAKSGIRFYRTNWFKFVKGKSMIESLNFYGDEVKKLSAVNREYGIIGCYQNHAGTDIGSSFWEIKHILEKADPDYFGTEYDIRHAVVEGGLSWENGLKLLRDHIKVIVLKDFKWGKVNGKWEIINVPIGEGMVDFDKYFKILKGFDLKPPVSLHLEYPLGGADKGHFEITVDKKVVFDAMKKDLMVVNKLWKNA